VELSVNIQPAAALAPDNQWEGSVSPGGSIDLKDKNKFSSPAGNWIQIIREASPQTIHYIDRDI
jgi:hypothetical protein